MTTAHPVPAYLPYRYIVHTDESVRRQNRVFELLAVLLREDPEARTVLQPQTLVALAVQLVDEVNKQAPLVEVSHD